MRTHRLERQQWLPQPLDCVFDFFSRAENLGRLTPPWLHFQMKTPAPVDMHSGALIDYTIRLAGIPLAWRTRIDEWKPGERFVDTALRSPYALWHHTHEFVEQPGGVLMTDRVDYALPLGVLGEIAHLVAVRAALAVIFDYRYAAIAEIFGPEIESQRT